MRWKVRGSILDRVFETFLLTKSFRAYYGPEVDSASDKNEHQGFYLEGKGGRFVRLTTLEPS